MKAASAGARYTEPTQEGTVLAWLPDQRQREACNIGSNSKRSADVRRSAMKLPVPDLALARPTPLAKGVLIGTIELFCLIRRKAGGG